MAAVAAFRTLLSIALGREVREVAEEVAEAEYEAEHKENHGAHAGAGARHKKMAASAPAAGSAKEE